MALGLVMWAVTLAGCVCIVLGWMHRVEMFWGEGILAFGNTVAAASRAAAGAMGGAAISAFLAVVLALMAWHSWHRRKRRRALRTLGAKSRARIAAMVTRMRERPSRRALRPVHGGAR